MGVVVRIVEEDEVDVVASLRRAWNEENAAGPIDDPMFETDLAAWVASEWDTRTFFVVELDGHAVGMANVKRYSRMPAAGSRASTAWGYVGNVFVLAEHRNDRLGERLMDEIVRWAGAQRLDHLRLAPSPRSTTFYARLGFQPGAVVELDPPRG